MKYVKMWVDTPYCGTKNTQYLEVPDDVDENDLNEECEEWSYSNADDYSYLATGWGEDFEDEDEREDYYADCSSYSGWTFISEEEYLETRE